MIRVSFALLVAVGLLAAGCGGSSSPAPMKIWVKSANPTQAGDNGFLTSVSCASRNFCVAVGARISRFASHRLVERWDGTAWRLVPKGAAELGHSTLTGVSCVSESFCAAVGNHFVSGTREGLAETWDGSTWRVTPVYADALSGVSCVTSSFCIAVGGASAEMWDGTRWTANGAARFAAVSCVSRAFCVAAGSTLRAGAIVPSAASWDGTRWTFELPPPISSESHLAAIACVSTDWCTAVGRRLHGVGSETLVERRAVTWSLRPSPSTAFNNNLTGIECLSRSSCIAVGATQGATLLDTWDGSEWTVTDAKINQTLSGVSCSPDGKTCFAVGTELGGAGFVGKPLVLRGS